MSKYLSQDFRSPIQRRAFGSLSCVLVLFYLCFHAVSGERGVFAMLRENSKLDELKAELADVKAKRESLEKKARRLADSNLDLDLLDERVRSVLGVAGKDEVVVFKDENKPN